MRRGSHKYYGKVLEPGATMSDHSAGFRAALKKSFPNAPFGQCWPHIIRKFEEGEYMKKTDSHFEVAKEHLRTIHLAGTTDMKELLIRETGKVWDTWRGKPMNTFWDSNCVEPWDCWSIGDFDCMLCTPSQNTQESWHKQLAASRIPTAFRSSTEHLFANALPDLVLLDGILNPKVLPFHVPCIPEGMMKKALWYVENQRTHVRIKKTADGEYVYYFLARDNDIGMSLLTATTIRTFENAMQGMMTKNVALPVLLDVCSGVHMVCQPNEDYGVPECEGNPCEKICLCCKGFKNSGICSHVLCVNHILTKFNVRAELATMGKRTDKKNKGGEKGKQVPKALDRIAQREPDSSDEEEERNAALAAQGK